MAKVLKTSETPNPLAIRFHMEGPVIASGSRSFPDKISASTDTTAARIFDIPNVTSVFYVGNTVTVNKTEDGWWEDMITPIADVLEETLVPGLPTDGAVSAQAGAGAEAEDAYAPGADIARPENFFALRLEDQVAHLNRILDEMVRPGLAGDGGGLELLGIEGTTVKIHYEGACGSCPSATSGTLMYIEGAVQKKAHPELVVATE